jgi:hypothetical protein
VANIFVAASATWNGKALKKAKQDVSVFDKQVKKLGTTLLGVFSARALYNYSKNAVKAFAADEKAAKSLEVQLKNTGFAFSSPAVELYIANLQRATGVLDDQLRPAFQQLLTVTGSITLSQNALNTALNVSAATGRSLTEVTAALAKGYAGNTTSLTRLGAGLSKTTLKAGDMDAILTELNNKFAGQAQARLTTYAGKMDLLRVASENVKEEIGKGILGALDALGKDTNLDETTAKMEKLGKTTGQTITGLGVLLKTLSDIPGLGALGRAAYETSTFGLLARLARENQKGKFPTAPARETPAQGRILAAQRRQELRASQDLLKLKKQEVTTLKAKTALDQLKEKFDIELIGLQKARNEATTDEVKARLDGLIAIAKNDDALAKKALVELKAAEELQKLADAAKKAADSLGTFDPAKFRMGENKDLGMDALQILAALTAMQGAASGLAPLAGMGTKAGKAADTLAYGQKYTDLNEVLTGGSVFDPSFFRRGESADLRITVDTAATGDRFAALIAESLQIAQKSGVSYGIAGGL